MGASQRDRDRRLILHCGDAHAARALARRGVIVHGVEMDLFVAHQLASPAWRKTVSHAARPEEVGQRVIDALNEVEEVLLDVKCPIGCESAGRTAIEAALHHVEATPSGRVTIISRNHQLVAMVANSRRAGPIVSDGLIHLEEYVRRLSASLVVTAPLFMDSARVAALASRGVATISFPATDLARLDEALALTPYAAMIEVGLEDGFVRSLARC